MTDGREERAHTDAAPTMTDTEIIRAFIAQLGTHAGECETGTKCATCGQRTSGCTIHQRLMRERRDAALLALGRIEAAPTSRLNVYPGPSR